jgi:hypothetical protein
MNPMQLLHAAMSLLFLTSSSLPHRFYLFPVNELAMYFPTRRANHGYLKLFVVAQAFVTEVPCKLFAVFNRFDVGIKLNADAIPHRNAVFHIKEKHRHTNCLISLMRGDDLKGLAETPRLGTNHSD